MGYKTLRSLRLCGELLREFRVFTSHAMKRSLKFFIIFFCLLLIFTPNLPSLNASYAGDTPLKTYKHEKINGGIIFTIGNSTYKGSITPGVSYSTKFSIDIPENATVRLARLYSYWCWSKNETIGVLPLLETNFIADKSYSINEENNYSDHKGFVGYYDYLSGVYSYDISKYVKKSGDYSVITKNIAKDSRKFCMYGFGLIIVYEGKEFPSIEYWIDEGCDMLYADYGISPKQATAKLPFSGELDKDCIKNAKLITVAPSAGYYQLGGNSLKFNSETWISDLPPVIKGAVKTFFKGEEGREWRDVFVSNKTVQIGIDERDVTKYMKSKGNIAKIQDNKDYMMVTNGILIVEYEEKGIFESLVVDNLCYVTIFLLIFVVCVFFYERNMPRLKISLPKKVKKGEKFRPRIEIKSRKKINGNLESRIKNGKYSEKIEIENFEGKRRVSAEIELEEAGVNVIEFVLNYKNKKGRKKVVRGKKKIEVE